MKLLENRQILGVEAALDRSYFTIRTLDETCLENSCKSTLDVAEFIIAARQQVTAKGEILADEICLVLECNPDEGWGQDITHEVAGIIESLDEAATDERRERIERAATRVGGWA